MITETYKTSTASLQPTTATLRYRRTWSDQNPGYWEDEDLKEVYSATVNVAGLLEYNFKDSAHTPGYGTLAKSRRVNICRKPFNLHKYLQVPVRPIFSPPKFRPRRKPKLVAFVLPYKTKGRRETPKAELKRKALEMKVNASRLKKFERKVQDWKLYEDKRLRRRREYILNFSNRIVHYEFLLNRLRERRIIVSKWANKKPKVSKLRGIDLPENYFKRIKLLCLKGESPLVCQNLWRQSFYRKSGALVEDPNVSVWVLQTFSGFSISPTLTLARDSTQHVISCLDDSFRSLEYKNTRKNFQKLNNRKVHIVNMVAERAQTLQMLTDAVRRLSEFLKLKKSFLKSLTTYLSSPKKLANDFLAFKFGVEPLVSDVKGLAELTAQLSLDTEDNKVVLVVRSNSKKRISLNSGGFTFNGTVTSSLVWKYYLQQDLKFARSLQSIGALNVTETAFEMAPWSFVLDWLIPISEYLSALSATCGLNWKAGTASRRFTGTVQATSVTEYWTGKPQYVDQFTTYETSSSFKAGEFILDYYQRSVSSEPKAESILKVNSPYSWMHGLESLALLVQRVRS